MNSTNKLLSASIFFSIVCVIANFVTMTVEIHRHTETRVTWVNEVWREEWKAYAKAHPSMPGSLYPFTGSFQFLVTCGGKRMEPGLRADGVVVWREVKP